MPVEILDPPLTFAPRFWAQERAIVSDAPELLYSGPYGCAKTRALCEKADMRCRLHRSARVVVARKKRVDLGSSVLPILLDQCITPAHRDWGWVKSAEGGSTLFYPNGSQILVVGLDDPGKLRSAEFDMVVVDQAEQLDEEEWNAAGGRLRWVPAPARDGTPAYRQLAGACNPADPSHFLFKRFRPDAGSHVIYSEADERLADGRVLKSGAVRGEVICGTVNDNFKYLPDDYQLRLSRYKGRYHDRYVLGLWIAYEGRVYDNFEPELHVIDRPREWIERWGGYPPPSWQRYVGIDFGYVNPFVCLWVARDPATDTFYVYREIYFSHRLVRTHATKIKAEERKELATLQECSRGQGIPPLDYLRIGFRAADHDSENAAQLANDGIATTPAEKEIDAGIQDVYELLASYDDDGVRKSHLYFLKDSLVEPDPALELDRRPLRTAEEIAGYNFLPRAVSSTARPRNPREEPADVDNHGCDALRYVARTLRVAGDVRVVRLNVSRMRDDD